MIFSVEISNSVTVICSYDLQVVSKSIHQFKPRVIVTPTCDNTYIHAYMYKYIDRWHSKKQFRSRRGAKINQLKSRDRFFLANAVLSHTHYGHEK
jgi:hypothetical protein